MKIVGLLFACYLFVLAILCAVAIPSGAGMSVMPWWWWFIYLGGFAVWILAMLANKGPRIVSGKDKREKGEGA